MLYFATPGSIPAHSTSSEISLSGIRLDACRVVQLTHFELGMTANVTAITSTSTVTFEFSEGWPAGSMQIQLFSESTRSNLLVMTLYTPPNITSIVPNRTSVAGGSTLSIGGNGLFSSSALLVSITTDSNSQIIDGTFIEADNTVQFEMPQFPIPGGLLPTVNDERVINATIQLSLNGVDFHGENNIVLSLIVSAVFKIGYLYVGPVTDFGWTYNWNIGRMEVDSRHPSLVKSEYVENVPEEFTAPIAEQQAAVLIRQYCERNFDMVVGTSFSFSDALVYMSNEPVCHFWTNETTGELTFPKITYLLHGTGNTQTPTMATVFTKIYEMKYLSGVLVGNQMVAEGSTNHLVGMVGSYAIPETIRHVNAFIRGCVEADPLCRVAIIWTETWFDYYIEEWAGTETDQYNYWVGRIKD